MSETNSSPKVRTHDAMVTRSELRVLHGAQIRFRLLERTSWARNMRLPTLEI